MKKTNLKYLYEEGAYDAYDAYDTVVEGYTYDDFDTEEEEISELDKINELLYEYNIGNFK